MARAVIGGLIASTLLTLVVVPVAYTYFDDFGSWVRKRVVSEETDVELERSRPYVARLPPISTAIVRQRP